MPLIGCGFTSTVFGVTTMNSMASTRLNRPAQSPRGTSRLTSAVIVAPAGTSIRSPETAGLARPGALRRELNLTSNLTVHTDKRAGPNGPEHARGRLLRHVKPRFRKLTGPEVIQIGRVRRVEIRGRHRSVHVHIALKQCVPGVASSSGDRIPAIDQRNLLLVRTERRFSLVAWTAFEPDDKIIDLTPRQDVIDVLHARRVLPAWVVVDDDGLDGAGRGRLRQPRQRGLNVGLRRTFNDS